MSNEDMKNAVKEAIKEWLDETSASLGKAVIKWTAGVLVAALLYYFVITKGFKL
jgi:hypothetical protein